MNAKESASYQEEKARVLFAKYGLTLEPGEWKLPATPGVPRVERKVRLRVHRTCHRCQTAFGSERVCSNCDHNRCKKCPGLPSATVPKGKGIAAGGVAVDDGSKESTGAAIMPNRATGNPLIRKSPTQRVRRNCHDCGSLFGGKAIQCENCNHTRCALCPRDPYVSPRFPLYLSLTKASPKKEKYLKGYPGDTEQTQPETKSTRTKVRWICEKCESTFMDFQKFCGNCGHQKCNTCARRPPQIATRPLDEGEVKSVEERMKSLDVSPQASAA